MQTRILAPWYRRLLLVVTLLLAQHAGTVHALGHLWDGGESAPGHPVHACCIAYQGLDHAPVTASVDAPAAQAAPRDSFPPLHFAPRHADATPYDSRAPPAVT